MNTKFKNGDMVRTSIFKTVRKIVGYEQGMYLTKTQSGYLVWEDEQEVNNWELLS